MLFAYCTSSIEFVLVQRTESRPWRQLIASHLCVPKADKENYIVRDPNGAELMGAVVKGSMVLCSKGTQASGGCYLKK